MEKVKKEKGSVWSDVVHDVDSDIMSAQRMKTAWDERIMKMGRVDLTGYLLLRAALPCLHASPSCAVSLARLPSASKSEGVGKRARE